jgi:hypothetical protein
VALWPKARAISLHPCEQDPFFAPIFRLLLYNMESRYLVRLQGGKNCAYDVAQVFSQAVTNQIEISLIFTR